MSNEITMVSSPERLKSCASYRVIEKSDLEKCLSEAKGGDTFCRSACGEYYYVPDGWCEYKPRYENGCTGDPVLVPGSFRTERNNQLSKEREG